MFRKSFLLLIIIFLAPSVSLKAQQLNGLTISPAIIATSQSAGELKAYNIKLFSDTNRTLNIFIKHLNKSTDANKPVVGENVSLELKNMFEDLPEQIFIKSGQENLLELKVNMPSYFLGNYNFGLVFEESSPEVIDSSNTTQTASQVVVPLIFNVISEEGNFYENLNVSKYLATPELSFDGENTFNITLKNEGISYLIPRGVLTVQPVNIIGTFKEQDISINTGKSIILRDGSLNLDVTNNFEESSIGQYKASLTVAYGLKNDIVTKDLYFWIIPQWFVILVTLLILTIFIFIMRKIYKLRNIK
ncbi:MAG: hypothetical protein ABIM99_03685 [Candidatus Dojkabacteria bacterium]